MVRVEYRLTPADTAWRTLELPDEATVAAAMEAALPREYWPMAAPAEDGQPAGYAALVNGAEVGMDVWERALLEAGDLLIIVPRAGRFLQALANAFIATLTAWLMGASGWQLAAVAAIAFATPYVMAWLAPSLDLGRTSRTYRVEGVGNNPRHWEAVPRVFGTFRWAPPSAALQYRTVADSTASGAKQRVRFLMDAGPGPLLFDEWLLGGVDTRYYDGFEAVRHDALTDASNSTLTLYGDLRRERPLSLEVTAQPRGVITDEDTSYVDLQLEFPRGLGRIQSGGGATERSVTVMWDHYPYVDREAYLDSVNVTGLVGVVGLSSASVRTITPTSDGATSFPGETITEWTAAAYDYDQYFDDSWPLENLGSVRARWIATGPPSPNPNRAFVTMGWSGAQPEDSLRWLNGKAVYVRIGATYFTILPNYVGPGSSRSSFTVGFPYSTSQPTVGDDGVLVIADAGLGTPQQVLAGVEPPGFGSGVTSSSYTVRAATTSSYFATVRIEFRDANDEFAPGRYVIKLRRGTAESTDPRNVELLRLVGVQTCRTAPPPLRIAPPAGPELMPPHTVIEGGLTATDQITGRVDALYVTTRALIPTWEAA